MRVLRKIVQVLSVLVIGAVVGLIVVVVLRLFGVRPPIAVTALIIGVGVGLAVEWMPMITEKLWRDKKE